MTLDGRYTVVSLLGEGGMGKVYLAQHVILGKRMAIKVLHDEYSRQEEVVKRFQQEAIAASQIGQENIVNVTDFGRTAEGALFFVMEELQGESLASAIRSQGAFTAERALPILAQVCRALAAAHARGIIHRDLKPENVVLTQKEDRPDFVKVLDFGISKVGASEQRQEKLTRMGTVMGTPEYMAPEQAAGTKVDHRVDIYSLGVMAYEMMTGSLPFMGDNPLAILIKHQSSPPEPPRKRRPDLGIGEDIEAIILKCLAKVPDGRPKDMAELIGLINQSLQQRGLRPMALTPGSTQVPLNPSGNRTPSGTMQLASSPPIAPQTPRGGTVQLPSSPPQPIKLVTPVTGQSPAVASRSTGLDAAELAAVKRGPGKGVIIGAAAVVVLGIGGFVVSRLMAPAARHEQLVTPTAVAPVATAPTSAAPIGVAPANVAPTPLAAAPTSAPQQPAPVPAAANPSTPAVAADSASAEAAKVATVSLRSTPPGAKVFEGTVELGQTPLDVEIRNGAVAVYRFSMGGYKDVSRKVASGDKVVEVALAKAGASKPHVRKAKSSGSSDEDDLKDDPFH
jgi:serine/threonine-protein kinase